MNPRLLLSLAIFAAIAIGSVQAAEPAKVRVGYINNVQSAVLAHLKTIQKDENLDIELIPFTRYPDVQKALSVNSVDVGVIAPNGLPAAVAQGRPERHRRPRSGLWREFVRGAQGG